jgi:cell wall-associated NlpC family hydrolase
MTYRHRARYRRCPVPGRFVGSAVAAGLIAAALQGHHASAASQGAPSRAGEQAIAFARAQLGKPYLWGGTGPDAFDCSGLTQTAYASAGISLQRTSEEQWASERQVSTPAAGDLVFFAGGDGTPTAPGHVGIVVDPARHTMIEAYATGYPVRYSQYGTAGSAPGDQDPVGFTDPAGGA